MVMVCGRVPPIPVRLGREAHRRVGAGERAALEQQPLPLAAFLGRRAQDGDPPAERLCERSECDAGTNAGRADDVVTASVADAGQRRRTRSR